MTTTQRSHPVAGMAVITVGMLVTLIGLGVWQLQRRSEKQLLVATLDERLGAAPVPLPAVTDWPILSPAKDEFRRVTFTAVLADKPDANVYASGSALRPDVSGLGAWVLAPARLTTGIVVVNRGFLNDGRTAAPGGDAPLNFTGYLRFPESAGVLTPREDSSKRLWFVRDHRAMARAYGWGNVAPFYVDLESPATLTGQPKPGPLQVRLKNNHLQYAITWFGLALVVAVAFGVWWRGQRRA